MTLPATLDPAVTGEPQAPYAIYRLAAVAGWPENTLRRFIQGTPEHGELLHVRSFAVAVIAARALKAGHDAAVIRALNAHPHLSSGMWLVSGAGHAHVFASMSKAACWIEDRPAASVTISSIGALSLDPEAR